MHQFALLKAENHILRQGIESLSKRRRAKRTRLQQGGSLSQQQGEELQDERDITLQVQQEMRQSSGRKPRAFPHARRCGNCNEVGHNARTCKIGRETTEK